MISGILLLGCSHVKPAFRQLRQPKRPFEATLSYQIPAAFQRNISEVASEDISMALAAERSFVMAVKEAKDILAGWRVKTLQVRHYNDYIHCSLRVAVAWMSC